MCGVCRGVCACENACRGRGTPRRPTALRRSPCRAPASLTPSLASVLTSSAARANLWTQAASRLLMVGWGAQARTHAPPASAHASPQHTGPSNATSQGRRHAYIPHTSHIPTAPPTAALLLRLISLVHSSAGATPRAAGAPPRRITTLIHTRAAPRPCPPARAAGAAPPRAAPPPCRAC